MQEATHNRTILDDLEVYVSSKLAGRELDARKAFAALVRGLEKTSDPVKAKSDAAMLAERWLGRAEEEAAAEQAYLDLVQHGRTRRLAELHATVEAKIEEVRPLIEAIGDAWSDYHLELDRLAGGNDALADTLWNHHEVQSEVITLSKCITGENPAPKPDTAVLARLERVDSEIQVVATQLENVVAHVLGDDAQDAFVTSMEEVER